MFSGNNIGLGPRRLVNLCLTSFMGRQIMSSEKTIFCGDTVDDDLPLDMQTKSLGDIKKILFYVKDLIAVISFKARKSILNLN